MRRCLRGDELREESEEVVEDDDHGRRGEGMLREVVKRSEEVD